MLTLKDDSKVAMDASKRMLDWLEENTDTPATALALIAATGLALSDALAEDKGKYFAELVADGQAHAEVADDVDQTTLGIDLGVAKESDVWRQVGVRVCQRLSPLHLTDDSKPKKKKW